MEESYSYTKTIQFPVISSSKEANVILVKILSNEIAVIGVDIEAAVEMSRFGILCLLQVIIFIIKDSIQWLSVYFRHDTNERKGSYVTRSIYQFNHSYFQEKTLLKYFTTALKTFLSYTIYAILKTSKGFLIPKLHIECAVKIRYIEAQRTLQ